MKKIIFSFSVVFFVTMLLISCEEDGLSGKYLFNDDLASTSKSPLAQIDFYIYSFSLDLGKLYEIINHNVDHSLEMILESRTFLTRNQKGGCGIDLTGICRIRFVKGDFELLKYYETGRIIFEYKNQGYSLNAGEEWTSVKTCFYAFIHEEFVSNSETTDCEIITNLGFIGNEKVKKLGGGNQIT